MHAVDLGVCEGREFLGDPSRFAVVLPGAHYLPGYPLLWFCREVLLSRGWSVLEAWDELGDGDDPEAWVRDRLGASLQRVSAAETIVLVAKSISTYASALPGAAGLPGVWLTPLLSAPAIAAALEIPTAPALLVGGSADPSWDAAAAGRSRAEVLEIEGADHALQVKGDPLASIDALGRLAERVDGFVAAL